MDTPVHDFTPHSVATGCQVFSEVELYRRSTVHLCMTHQNVSIIYQTLLCTWHGTLYQSTVTVRVL